MAVQRKTRKASKVKRVVKSGKPAAKKAKPGKKSVSRTTKPRAKSVKKSVSRTTKPRATSKPVKPVAKSASRKRTVSAVNIKQLGLKHFAPLLHERFYIQPEAGEPLEVELIQAETLIEELSAAPRQVRRQPFSVVFRSQERDTYLPQHTYHVKHAKLGSLGLFLVPIGPDEQGMRYQAIFT